MFSLTWSAAPPVRALPSTAQRFIGYLNALERGGQRMTFWERMMYSLALTASNEEKRKPRPHARGAS